MYIPIYENFGVKGMRLCREVHVVGFEEEGNYEGVEGLPVFSQQPPAPSATCSHLTAGASSRRIRPRISRIRVRT